MSIITFIGAGQMASALTFPVFENGHEVRLVGTHLDDDMIDELRKSNYHPKLKRTLHDGIRYYKSGEMEQAIDGAAIIVCGVNSFGVDWFAENVLPRIPEHVPVIAVTKGLLNKEDGSLCTYPDFWRSTEAGKRLSINAIGGPSTSYELAQHVHIAVTFCGYDMKILQFIKDHFKTDYYHIHLSTDVVGLETAVAMKNAYALSIAIATGMAQDRDDDARAQHYSTQAALFGQGVLEMKRLVTLLGGTEASLLCGLSDMYATVYGGRTRKAGILLGREFNFDDMTYILNGVTLESLTVTMRTAKAIRTMAAAGKVSLDEYPLLLNLDDILHGDGHVHLDWDKFDIN